MGEGAQRVQRLVALDLAAAGVVVGVDAFHQVPRADHDADALRAVQLEQREAGGVRAQFHAAGGDTHHRVVVVDDGAYPVGAAGGQDLARVVAVGQPLPGVLDVRPGEPSGRQGLVQGAGVVEVDLGSADTERAQRGGGGAVDRRAVDQQFGVRVEHGAERRPDGSRARALDEGGGVGAEEVGEYGLHACGRAGTAQPGHDSGVGREELFALEVAGGALQQPELRGDGVVQGHRRQREGLRQAGCGTSHRSSPAGRRRPGSAAGCGG